MSIVEDVVAPWVVLGDFNSTFNPHDRNKQITKASICSMNKFCLTIDNCLLVDASFQGAPFTWQMGTFLRD